MGCEVDCPATFDDFLARIEPSDRGRVAAGLTDATGAGFELDIGFTRRDDGECRRGRLWGEVHRDASGRSRRVVLVMRDTTVEQAAITVVRAVERRLVAATQAPMEPVTRPVDDALTAALPATDICATRAVARPPGH